METNKEAIVFKLEADSSGLKKTIIDAETLAENAAESTKNKVKGAADKASEDVSAATEKIQADVAKSSEKIKSILSDTETSVRSKVASIAGVYKSEGMSQSDAMKKAWSQIDRSSASTASKVKTHSSETSGKVKNDVQSIAKKVKSSSADIQSSASGTASSVGSAFSSMAKKVGGAIAAAFAVSKIVAFSKECLSLGSDLAEVQNVVDVTFGTMSSSVDKFAKDAAKQFGLSETMAKKYAGTYGSMAEAFGFTQKQALDMSEALTGLTGDVASFYNISQDEAYTKLKSVFSGETETLKDLGVVMTQSALDAYALSKGFGKTTAEMSEAEKVSLRYAFVQEKLANAQGDYARTSDGWANSTRTLALQFDTLKAELGQGLINVFSPIVQWLNIIVERLSTAATKFKEFTAAIMGVSADASSGMGAAAVSTDALTDSLDGTESSAKSAAKAMRDLMGFDEINRLSDNSGSTDSGSAASAGQTTAVIPDTSGEEKRLSILEGPLKKLKELWDDLYGSFKKGLTTRLDAGNVFDNLGSIKDGLMRIRDAMLSIFTNGSVVSAAKYMLEQIATFFGSLVGNFISIGVSLCNALITGIADFLDEKKDFLTEKLASIFQSTGDIFGSLTDIMNDVTDIINYILQLPETAQVIADAINIVVTPLVTYVDLTLKLLRDNLEGLAKVIKKNKESFKKIGKDIMGFLSTVTGAVSGFVDSVCAKAESVYDTYLKPAMDNIWAGINNLVTFLCGIWQQYISPMLSNIGSGIQSLFEQHITPMAEKVMEFAGKLINVLSQLWKNILEPIVEWVISAAMPKIKFAVDIIWTVLKSTFGWIADMIGFLADLFSGIIDFLTGVFTGDWEKAWSGIKEIFGSYVDLIKNALGNFVDFISGIVSAIGCFFESMGKNIQSIFSGVWDKITSIFSNVKEFFTGAFGAAWDAVKKIFSDPKAFFSSVWDKITSVFSNAKDVFKEKFDAAVTGIKDAFSGIKEWFSDLWDDISSALKAPVNVMIDILNFLIEKINSLSFDVPDWVPGIGGTTFGFNIPEIPYLANGGYVKANTPQLAVIGDNKREGEIVAPESKITEAVAEALRIVLAKLGTENNTAARKEDTVLQANIWLGNELLSQQLVKMQQVRNYRSGGLA